MATSLKPNVLSWDAPELLRPMAGLYVWNGQTYMCQPGQASNQQRYRRRNWAELESTKGVYNFAKYQPELDEAKKRRQRVTLGLAVLCGPPKYGPYVPSYMQVDGMGYWFTPDPAKPADWYPNLNSAAVRERLEALLRAFSDWLSKTGQWKWVSGIECLAFGRFGEGYMPWQMYKTYNNQADHPALPTNDTCRKVVDLYHSLFSDKVRLEIPLRNDWRFHYAMTKVPYWSWNLMSFGDPGQMKKATEAMNSTITVDGLHTAPLVADRWMHAPVRMEWIGDYSGADFANQWAAGLQQLQQFRPSLVGNGNFLGNYSKPPFWFWDGSCAPVADTQWTPQNIADMITIGKRAGYRLVLNELVFQDIVVGETSAVNMSWRNIGEAPVTEPWQMDLSLRTVESNGLLTQYVFPSAFNPCEVMPESAAGNAFGLADALSVPDDFPPGEYLVHAYFPPKDDTLRPLPLGIEGVQADGSYLLGKVTVEKPKPKPNARLMALADRCDTLGAVAAAVINEANSLAAELRTLAQPNEQ